MTTVYEWTLEHIDQYGDIIEVHFGDKLRDVLSMHDPDYRNDIGLIRRTGDDINGEEERYYAYIKDGILPETFEECNYTVPKRFHKELASNLTI